MPVNYTVIGVSTSLNDCKGIKGVRVAAQDWNLRSNNLRR